MTKIRIPNRVQKVGPAQGPFLHPAEKAYLDARAKSLQVDQSADLHLGLGQGRARYNANTSDNPITNPAGFYTKWIYNGPREPYFPGPSEPIEG